MSDITILGGGFGGLTAAHRLRSTMPDAQITVLDRKDRFYPGLAKLWDMVEIRPLEESSRPLGNLEAKGISFRQTEIVAIDPATRTVETNDGPITSDALLIALGAAFNQQQLDMLTGNAFNLYEARSLPGVRSNLQALESGRVVITVMGLPYKCPPAPYEAAMLIDEWLRDRGRRDDVDVSVHTPQPSPLPVAGVDASATMARELDRYGIGFHPERQPKSIADGTVTFGDGSTEGYDLLLGVPAHVAPPVLVDAGLTGKSGWIEPDRETLATGFERVYAVGDCTHIPNAKGALPKAGVFAESEGIVAADNIAADLGMGKGAVLDGMGFCFLEFPGRRAATVEGDFLAEPEPAVTLSPPSEETFRAKEAFVAERLDRWL
ncbi:MAG: NAD(P)/FAD-dependent oxidoreductase [Actinomycetota bacterium]